MIPILSRAQMRAFDSHAILTSKVPSLVLMENAGRGAALVIEREMLEGVAAGKRLVVVAGTGNNGGDGFVVARHLLSHGGRVTVFLAGLSQRMSHDCKANHDAFVGIGGHVAIVPMGQAPADLLRAIEEADVVVDALFGTGLDRAIEEPMAAVVRAINARSPRVAALDTPSGMNADTGVSMGATVNAYLTIAFGHRKLGHVTPHGARLSGKVHTVDLGVPPELRADHAAAIVEPSDVKALLSPRAIDAHKYRAGHVGIFAGSPGKTGAALLASQGALRGGAGAATIISFSDSAAAIELRVLEVMTARLEDGDALGEQIDAALAHKRAVVVGPGFGTDARAEKVVRYVVGHFGGPIVADADALTIYAGKLEDIAVAGGRAILTPHAGELARLLGSTSEEVGADRFASASMAAAKANAVVLLKGAYTVIASPDGRVVVNTTGNPALATAGSGDVLSGLAAALACSLAPFEAACCAAYIHGAAGDMWRAEHGDRGLLAGEIARTLPDVLHRLTQ